MVKAIYFDMDGTIADLYAVVIMKLKPTSKDKYLDCPTFDFMCPYYDENRNKCAMLANNEGDPREECDAYAEE